jgi:hypothetical protein
MIERPLACGANPYARGSRGLTPMAAARTPAVIERLRRASGG